MSFSSPIYKVEPLLLLIPDAVPAPVRGLFAAVQVGVAPLQVGRAGGVGLDGLGGLRRLLRLAVRVVNQRAFQTVSGRIRKARTRRTEKETKEIFLDLQWIKRLTIVYGPFIRECGFWVQDFLHSNNCTLEESSAETPVFWMQKFLNLEPGPTCKWTIKTTLFS